MEFFGKFVLELPVICRYTTHTAEILSIDERPTPADDVAQRIALLGLRRTGKQIITAFW